MKRLLLLSSAFTCLTLVAQTATGPLPNPGFEEGEAHWSLADHGMSKVAPEAAHSGRLGLRVADDSVRSGSSCRSAPVPAAPGKTSYTSDPPQFSVQAHPRPHAREV